MEKLTQQELLKYLVKYILIGTSILIVFLLARSVAKGIPHERKEKAVPAKDIMEEKKKALSSEEELMRGQIFEVIEKEPGEVAQIVRIWLREGKNGDRLRKSYG